MEQKIDSPPSIKGSYLLSDKNIRAFQQQGYAFLTGIATPEEISAFRPLINNAVKRLNEERRKLEERDTYGKAFLQTMNLWEQDENVRNFTMAKKFASVAAALLGVEKVRLYHDQALYKEPGG
jgi:hypothetical protein